MGEIIQYIVVHWVEWLFVAISTFLGLCYRQMAKRQKEESRKMPHFTMVCRHF